MGSPVEMFQRGVPALAEFSKQIDAIRKARGCHCKKSFAECLCGLSWWKRFTGEGERERWNEALRISSPWMDQGDLQGRIV